MGGLCLVPPSCKLAPHGNVRHVRCREPRGSELLRQLRCAARGSNTSLEQRKTVTVVFCDVTGSTALGERLDSESAAAR